MFSQPHPYPPPQNPWGAGLNHPMSALMPPSQYPPQQSEFINLDDDNPQEQIGSEVSSHHRVIEVVTLSHAS